jgi:hypothetical protein
MFRGEASSRSGCKLAACGLILGIGIGLGGCTPPAPPAASEEPAELRCDDCGKVGARQDTEPRVSLDGTDVYTCRSCLAKARPGRARPPARTPGKTSSGQHP